MVKTQQSFQTPPSLARTRFVENTGSNAREATEGSDTTEAVGCRLDTGAPLLTDRPLVLAALDGATEDPVPPAQPVRATGSQGIVASRTVAAPVGATPPVAPRLLLPTVEAV